MSTRSKITLGVLLMTVIAFGIVAFWMVQSLHLFAAADTPMAPTNTNQVTPAAQATPATTGATPAQSAGSTVVNTPAGVPAVTATPPVITTTRKSHW
ncbi:hypothetical protein [Dictyobacter kobayashii]|uniref:Uncharacterized protein n=1 Tax=Dictyobacter kobayashii TaxID=2014872 RepID=A0A402AL38_9CHLR|nr:hypothetical protein [Dictyobacter kobayashii]GCE19769.1 hypothetical protein KDK_35690 [Dictyobacter kobayashii]